MTSAPDWKAESRGWGLTFRVIALLSIALLPLGLIAVFQTREYERESLRRSELALLALTERASSSEAELIENAVGAARSFATTIDVLSRDPAACGERMTRFIQEEQRYSFAGFVPADGMIECSSAGRNVDINSSESFRNLRDHPRSLVYANPDGAISGEWVIVVSEPVFEDDVYTGAVAISIPHRLLARTGDESLLATESARPLQLITFNKEGQVISRLAGPSNLTEEELPPGPLTGLIGQGARAFSGPSRSGEERSYAVTPIVPDAVYALGVWEREERSLAGLPSGVAAVLFPALMWAVSLIVASFAMHRMVLTHIQSLRRKMRSFGRSRRLVETIPRPGTPSEFREMDAEFMSMAENVLRDEAQLENAVREKNILLKEIHHRVKNNLQLLSSITSMKRRKAKSQETRDVLGRLQNRILSLAAIHRNLYQSKDMSNVEAGSLVADIAAQQGLTPGQGRLLLEIDPVQLVPQQAVPMSLLVAECLSGLNGHSTEPRVRITLTEDGDGLCELVVLVEPRKTAEPTAEDGTIGDNLMIAFADQLSGKLERETTEDGSRRVSVTFQAISAVQDALDY